MTQNVPHGLSPAGRELLARRLGGRPATPAPGPDRPDRPGGRSRLSPAQRRLWFIDRLAEGGLAYNVPAAFRLRGPLDADALERALDLVISRHAVLRSRFPTEGGEPYRDTIDPADEPRLVRHDLTAEDDPVGAAHGLARRAADTCFDLARGPLLRTWLARLGPDDHVFGLVVHHIVFDRDSLEALSTEMSAAYRAFAAGAEPDLPALRADYADFAEWQHQATSGERFEAKVAHWRDTLRDVPVVLELPADLPRPAMPSYRAGEVTVRVPAGAAAGLRGLSAVRQATLFMTCLAAFHALLARYTGAGRIAVGCPFNGRTKVVYEGLIGFFANTLPITARLADDPPFGTLLDRVREAMLTAHAHQEVPFDRIVQETVHTRDLSRNPLVQVWFDLAGGGPDGAGQLLDLPGVRIGYFSEGRTRTRFDLELHLVEAADGEIRGRLLYALDLFEPATAEAFVRHYTRFLCSVAERPEQRLSRVPIFSAAELGTLLEEWGSGAPAAPGAGPRAGA